MNRGAIAAVALAGLALAASPALCGDAPTLDKLELGTHLYGDPLSAEDLAGRVVVAYFWDAG